MCTADVLALSAMDYLRAKGIYGHLLATELIRGRTSGSPVVASPDRVGRWRCPHCDAMRHFDIRVVLGGLIAEITALA
jgi:hypothetical protein